MTRFEIHEHELPLVPCMVHPHSTDGIEMTMFNLDELKRQAETDMSVRWALETIRELQRLWFESTDKLAEIEAIISRERVAA